MKVIRWVAAGTAIATGLALLITPFVLQLFSETAAAERLAAGVRPAMTQSALAADLADLQLGIPATNELQDPVIPAVVKGLQLTPDQVRSRYPDLTSGLQTMPSGVGDAASIVHTLDANRSRFEAADSLPLPGIAVGASPWFFIVIGAALLSLGSGTLLTRSLLPLAGLLVLAILSVAVPFAISLPQKADDSQALVDALRPVLTRETAVRIDGEAIAFTKMIAQIQNQALPDYEHKTNQSPAQVSAFIASNAPELAVVQPKLDPLITKYTSLEKAFGSQVDNFQETAKIPFRAITWLFVGPGLLVGLLASAALVAHIRGRRGLSVARA